MKKFWILFILAHLLQIVVIIFIVLGIMYSEDYWWMHASLLAPIIPGFLLCYFAVGTAYSRRRKGGILLAVFSLIPFAILAGIIWAFTYGNWVVIYE